MIGSACRLDMANKDVCTIYVRKPLRKWHWEAPGSWELQ